MRNTLIPGALLLALCTSLPAHAADFGAVASGIANVAGALGKGQQTNEQSADANAKCQQAVNQNQDKLALAKALGEATGNQKIIDGSARLQNGCNELMAEAGGATPVSANTDGKADAAATGLKVLGGLLGQ